MTLREINEGNRVGTKVKSPKGVVGYFRSMGKSVVNLAQTEQPTEGEQLFSQIVNTGSDALKWQVVGADVPCNCHRKTKLDDINNT